MPVLLNERLRITFDYYIKTTTDLLALVQLPPSAGVSAGIGSGPGQIIDNVGEVENKGWELTLGANLLNNGDWTIAIDVNLSQNRNKVTKTKKTVRTYPLLPVVTMHPVPTVLFVRANRSLHFTDLNSLALIKTEFLCMKT